MSVCLLFGKHREGRLRIVLPSYIQTAHISAVYPDRHNLSAKVRTFIEHLSSHLEEVAKAQPLVLTGNEIRSATDSKR